MRGEATNILAKEPAKPMYIDTRVSESLLHGLFHTLCIRDELKSVLSEWMSGMDSLFFFTIWPVFHLFLDYSQTWHCANVNRNEAISTCQIKRVDLIIFNDNVKRILKCSNNALCYDNLFSFWNQNLQIIFLFQQTVNIRQNLRYNSWLFITHFIYGFKAYLFIFWK